MGNTVTFYVIRALKDSDKNISSITRSNEWDYANPYEFLKNWYASREFVKPFCHARFFPSKSSASKYLRSSSTLGKFLDGERETYFEIVPIEINEPV